MISQMLSLVELFAARVEDRSALDELYLMIGDEESWHKAKDLFSRVRRRSLDTNRSDLQIIAECNFEESCAKTLFNLTDTKILFNEDAPYWVVPQALRFARQLGLDEGEITIIVAGAPGGNHKGLSS